jgi:hypothetical protein
MPLLPQCVATFSWNVMLCRLEFTGNKCDILEEFIVSVVREVEHLCRILLCILV